MKKQPHRTQRIIGLIAQYSFCTIILAFFAIYILTSLFFAILYFAGGWLDKPSLFGGHFYFSFITQATVGYGDYAPIGFGRVVSCAQVLIGLAWVGLGTSVIVMKLLTPSKDAIIFDSHLAYDPKEDRFRIRYANTLPVELHNVDIEMRLRHLKETPWKNKKVSRLTINLLRKRVPLLPPLRPFLCSTRPPSSADRALPGERILTPDLSKTALNIEVVMTAQYFAGSVVASRPYFPSDLVCGLHAPTHENDDPVNWENWDEIRPPAIDECQQCTHHNSCVFKKSESPLKKENKNG